MVRPKINISKDVGHQILRKAKIDDVLDEVKELYNGWNSIFLLKTNKKIYSLRIFTTNFGFHGNEWKAEKERYIYKKLNEKKVKVPEFFYLDKTKQIIPYDYILIEYLPGFQLSEIDGAVQKNKRRSSTFSEKEYSKVLYDVGKQMALIHSIKMPRLSVFDFPLDRREKWVPFETFDKYLKRCANNKLKEEIKNYAKRILKKLPKNLVLFLFIQKLLQEMFL